MLYIWTSTKEPHSAGQATGYIKLLLLLLLCNKAHLHSITHLVTIGWYVRAKSNNTRYTGIIVVHAKSLWLHLATSLKTPGYSIFYHACMIDKLRPKLHLVYILRNSPKFRALGQSPPTLVGWRPPHALRFIYFIRRLILSSNVPSSDERRITGIECGAAVRSLVPALLRWTKCRRF